MTEHLGSNRDQILVAGLDHKLLFGHIKNLAFVGCSEWMMTSSSACLMVSGLLRIYI